jgi:hypothetical protein
MRRMSQKQIDGVLKCLGPDIRLKAKTLFQEVPSLQDIVGRLCNYLPTVVVIEDEITLHVVLKKCIESATSVGCEAPLRAFLVSLRELAVKLSHFRVSVQDEEGVWMIWDCGQDLADMLDHHKRNSVQVRRRESPLGVGTLFMVILTNVCSVEDLNEVGIVATADTVHA